MRCSQAAAAVGDDVFYFGGSYYKCALTPCACALTNSESSHSLRRRMCMRRHVSLSFASSQPCLQPNCHKCTWCIRAHASCERVDVGRCCCVCSLTAIGNMQGLLARAHQPSSCACCILLTYPTLMITYKGTVTPVPDREDQTGLQPLADTFVLDTRALCWQVYPGFRSWPWHLW